MADPASLALISAGTGLVGGGIQAFGNYFTGKAQSNMANYQAGVALANASVAKQDAIYAQQSGEVQSQQAGMRGRAVVGATKAGFGAGNISLASGSPSRVLASDTSITQQNEGIIRADAAKRAYGFNVSAASDVAQAGADYSAAKTSREASGFNIASTVLGGVGSVSNKWLQASQYFPSNGSPT